jgi:hypothetical protein
MEALKRLKEHFARGEPEWLPITVDDTGFSSGSRRVDWASVQSVSAFKRDMLTFDDVWFQVEAAGEPVLVCEEQPGFATMEAALSREFPSVATWRELVIKPAFAENFTVLYRRT